jgi:hypothetical protein
MNCVIHLAFRVPARGRLRFSIGEITWQFPRMEIERSTHTHTGSDSQVLRRFGRSHRSTPAAKRRQNVAHGLSRGFRRRQNTEPRRGERSGTSSKVAMDKSFHLLLEMRALRAPLSLAQMTAFRRTAAGVPDPAPIQNLSAPLAIPRLLLWIRNRQKKYFADYPARDLSSCSAGTRSFNARSVTCR